MQNYLVCLRVMYARAAGRHQMISRSQLTQCVLSSRRYLFLFHAPVRRAHISFNVFAEVCCSGASPSTNGDGYRIADIPLQYPFSARIAQEPL